MNAQYTKIITSLALLCTVALAQQTGVFTDSRDGQTYKTVKIGKQTWMAENLNYGAEGKCYCNDDSEHWCYHYGRLYNWNAAKKVCPECWHLPSNAEWDILMKSINSTCSSIGRCINAGKLLKAKLDVVFYGEKPDNSTDAFGFSALLGGDRDGSGKCKESRRKVGRWWNASEFDAYDADSQLMRYSDADVYRFHYDKRNLFSVRCVLDSLLPLQCVEAFSQDEKKSFKDTRDGKIYKIVKIGEQTWMAENLKYEAEGSKCNDYYNPAYCEKYGRYYDWNTAVNACPSGWHLPSNAEWKTLIDFAGGFEKAGKFLKAKYSWDDYKEKSGNGTDALGFSALAASYSNLDISFFYGGGDGIWWTSSNCNYDENKENDPERFACSRYIIDKDDYVFLDRSDKKYNFYSVRCVQD